ncbi:MAG: hypothetical protein F6K24_08185 [Okeania sp. SIO2D1]|nr:hypothetical protein [Okeania sp. SIO2D1]
MLTVGLLVIDAEIDQSTENSVTNTIEKGRRQKADGRRVKSKGYSYPS